MGAWGPGLYSDDFALDLRSTIAAVARLPMSGDELVAILESLEPTATDVDDPDHTTFWLVVADQFHKRGIASHASERALQIIDSGSDLQRLRDLGMGEPDLRKRAVNLTKLREQLIGPPSQRARTTMKAPQPLILQPGELYAFPVDSAGQSINPYFPPEEAPPFVQKAWGVFLVLSAGHALGYLAWYQVAVAASAAGTLPGLRRARRMVGRGGRTTIGTLKKSHYDRLRLVIVGVTHDLPPVAPPIERVALRRAAQDISISNGLELGVVSTLGARLRRPKPEIT